MLESETNVTHDTMEPINTLDPPPCDPPTSKIPLWLHGTLQDVERHVAARGTFREINKPFQYQVYVVAMSNMI